MSAALTDTVRPSRVGRGSREFSGQRPLEQHRSARAGLLAAALTLVVPLLSVPVTGWTQIEEIVVTARKREESLTDVPIAVEAFTAEDLERKGIADIAALAQQSASIKFDQGANRSDTRLSIRGISPTRGRQNAAINVDGIDISSESVQSSGGSILINQRLMSLERVEVVKGPQIALWGRSAFNGAINFVTKDPPEELGGEFTVDGNEEDQYSFKGELGGPILGERLGVMLTGGWWDEDGLYRNVITNQEMGGEQGYGFSLKTKSDFGNGLVVRARAQYEHYEFDPTAEAFIGFNRLVRNPQTALTDVVDPRLPPPPAQQSTLFCLQRELVNDPNFPYPDSAALPPIMDLDPDPNNPNEVVDRLYNQTLVNRYRYLSLDPNNPVMPDSPSCQEIIPIYAGTVPDGDQLRTRLSTNPFTPGQDYEGVDGDLIRLSLTATWELDRGAFSWWTGYLHDTNDEFQDNGKWARRDPDSEYLVSNVNLSHADTEKFTRQFQQEIRYATKFDGPVNVTMGGNYWEEDVDTDSRNLTWQSNGTYCFYSSNSLDDADALGNAFFGGVPPCPGYTELPIAPFVNGGFDWGDPAAGAYPGVARGNSPCGDLADPDDSGNCIRPSPVDRSTDHRSIYGMVEIQTSETTKLTLEGRYSHEELTVTGAKFLNPFATGGPQSWSICGAPGRPCDLALLTRPPGPLGSGDLGGPFYNPANFQRVYDVWDPYNRIQLPARPGEPVTAVPAIDLIPEECLSDPAVQERIATSEANGPAANDDGVFDMFNPFCIGKLERTDQWFSPKITLDWKPNADSLIYVYWARAEKPGGFTLFTVGASGLRRDLAEFEPEVLDTYEIGGNTTILDNTLLVSGAVFYNDYTDKQVLITDIGFDGRSISKITNAPAELWGAEVSAMWKPFETFVGGEWSVSGSYTYIDSEYLDFIDEFAVSETNIALNHLVTGRDCTPTVKDTDLDTGVGTVRLTRPACSINWKGNQFERSPEHSFTSSIAYTRALTDEMEGYAELDAQWKDEQPIEFDNVSWIDAYWNLDLRLGLKSVNWDVQGYVTNLLDDDTVRSASNQPGLSCCFHLGVTTDLGGQFGSVGSTAEVPSARAAFLPPPRIFGLRATYRFGGAQ
jgi:outer membrane receptor protein involved in Fe transport